MKMKLLKTLMVLLGAMPGAYAEEPHTLLNCADQHVSVLVQRVGNENVLTIREQAFHGNTLGLLMGPDIDPEAHVVGTFMEFKAKLPAEGVEACRTSSSHPEVLSCGTGADTDVVSVGPGIQTTYLANASVFFGTERRLSTTAFGTTDSVIFRYTLYSEAHPFDQHGYSGETEFSPGQCQGIK